MSVRVLESQIAALDAAMEWERQCYLMNFTAAEQEANRLLADLRERQADDDANSRVYPWAAKLGGLVSVPTSGARKRRAPPIPFRVSAHHAAVSEAIGAFRPDPVAARLARMRRAVGFGARANIAEAPEYGRCSMVTLTYAEPDAWEPRHVSDYLKRVREWAKRQGFGFRYVWVAEIQPGRLRRTGDAVVHYHVAIWLPAGVEMPLADECGWWPHGMTRTEWARAAVPYLLKYLSKGEDVASFPKGLRTFGVGGMSDCLKRARRWLGLPAFVRERSSLSDDWRRAAGGGWVDPAGRHWASEFRTAIVGGVRSLVRVLQHGPGFVAADGPFSWLPDASPWADFGRVDPPAAPAPGSLATVVRDCHAIWGWA